MALLWIEGFEGFGTSTGVAPSPTGILARKYYVTNEAQMDIEAGRGGIGYCLEIYRNADSVRSPSLTTNSTCVLGLAVNVSAFSTFNTLFWLFEGVNQGVGVRSETDGTLTVYRGATSLGSTSNSITAGTWYYMELKVLTDNTVGTVELRVNGTTWLSLTSQDTQPGSNSYHNSFQLGPLSYIYTSFDDIYFLDASGSINNDFLGNQVVRAIRPDGDGTTTDWTPSTGNNHENVDEDLLDEDTSYNEVNTVNQTDLFTYDDLSTITSIAGTMVMTEVRMTTGSMDIVPVIKSGSTTDEGASETVTSTIYITNTRLDEVDPNTSSAWTDTNLNAAEFGYKSE